MGKQYHLYQHAQYLLGFVLILSSTCAVADQDAKLCDANYTDTQSLPSFKDDTIGKTQISADQTKILADGISRFTGNVVIEQHQIRLKADSADFNKQSKSISLYGNIQLDTKAFSLSAKTGTLSLEDGGREFKSAQFLIPGSNLRGEAEFLQSDDENTSHLINALITSCPIDKVDWTLRAKKLSVKHADSYGIAENAVLDFKGVPFFYLPYFEFPIGDKRRNGILSPSFSSSSSRGLELAIPWYWNIAPNHDATFTPRLMSKRGTSIETQYRYLTKLSTGEFNLAYLGHDSKTNDARHYVNYQHKTVFNKKTRLSVDFSDVSDTDYNNDFSNIFSGSNQTYLDREITLEYNSDYWRASVLAHTAETINATLDVDKRPYRRLPQIQAEAELPVFLPGLISFVSTEAAIFEHEDNAVDTVTGSRFMISPGIRYSIEGDAWYLRPSFEIHHTTYDTKDRNGTPVFADSRTLPMTSIDGGLYFERKTDNALVQTLEPRIFYLNVPFKDQSSIPIFDTDLNDFKVDQLFRNNRYNGNDLIGDANQLSLALTSRLYNPETGNELINASIGRIIFFRDRKVVLPLAGGGAGPIETESTSDIIVEVSSSIDNWKFQAGTQWNTRDKVTEKDNFSIQYKSDQKNIFNLSYRKNNLNANTGLSDVRHINTSFITQISDNVSLFGQWDYSLKDDRDITVFAGIIYDSCCWQLSLATHRFLLNDQNQEFDTTVMLQLTLKGFGGVSGNSVRNTLRQSIPGYIEDY